MVKMSPRSFKLKLSLLSIDQARACLETVESRKKTNNSKMLSPTLSYFIISKGVKDASLPILRGLRNEGH